MRANTFGRVMMALFALALFIAYTYLHAAATPHSFELGKTEPAAAQGTLSTAPAAPADDTTAQVEPEATPEPATLVSAEPTPTPEPTVDPASPYGIALANAAAQGLPTPPDVDIDSWELMLVNKDHPLDANYAPPIIVNVSSSQCPQDSRIAEALDAFADAAIAEGLPVYLSSGYRGYAEQQYLYNRKIDQGYSPDQAATIVARPGTSEHQTGLACDITDYYRELKDSSLEQTPTYIWMKEHCAEYGFVVRYPADKSGSADSVTGIIYEPWHFRYVGVEAAAYMTENNLCLEEFLALYGVE